MLRLLANVDLLLATILVVNNLVNICIVILTAGIIDSVFTFLRFEFLFKTVLVTFLLLLFGEISDESDNDECFYTRLDAKSYIFEGKTHLGDFERILDIGEDVFADVRGEAETLAGLMLELKRDFPRKGDVFTSHDLRFTVQEMDGHRVDKIRVDLQ